MASWTLQASNVCFLHTAPNIKKYPQGSNFSGSLGLYVCNLIFLSALSNSKNIQSLAVTGFQKFNLFCLVLYQLAAEYVMIWEKKPINIARENESIFM